MTDKEYILTALHSIPYPYQVSNLDLNGEPDVIRFTWRGDVFRVSYRSSIISVEECKNGCLHGSNISILMKSLLTKEVSRLVVNNIRSDKNVS